MIYKNKTELINKLICKDDLVLDVGFWGQGIGINNKNWVHNLILSKTGKVYGLDLDYDESFVLNKENYKKSSAEDFNFDVKFDKIFAGDIIEHLSNQGLFLKSCTKNLKSQGRLIITTPNCFGFFNLSEKISKDEPTVNKDHTCYYNKKTLSQLLKKNGWEVIEISYLYSLEVVYKESLKKKFLNIIYRIISLLTPKFSVGLVVVAKKIDD